VVRVILATVGVHDGLAGTGFVIADSDDGAPTAAYQDTAIRGQVTDDATDIASLTATWERVTAEALPRSASLALIEEIGRTWTT
jgi:Domain of unknown function (DUF5753)